MFDVQNCQNCKVSLENSYRIYTNQECTEAICHECDDKEMLENYLKDRVVTSSFMLNNTAFLWKIKNDSGLPSDQLLLLKERIDVQLAINSLKKKIKEFEKKVWFSGLQDLILKSGSCKGFSAKLDTHNNFCVLTYTMAGRTMITFEDKTSFVTIVADQTSKESRTGLNGLCSTGDHAIELIDLAISLYENGNLKFVDDDKVGFPF